MLGLDDLRARFGKLYAAEEKLRLEHNEVGQRFENGEFSERQWLAYVKNDFGPKSAVISAEIGNLRNQLLEQIDFEVQPLDSTDIMFPVDIDTDQKRMHYLLVLTHRLQKRPESEFFLRAKASNALALTKERLKHAV